MFAILSDFAKALAQISDRSFRRVVGLGVLLTIALLFAVYAAVLGLINMFSPEAITLPVVGEITWVGDLLSYGSILLMIVASIFLMIPTASLMTSFFLDDIADAVENKHYPTLPPAGDIGFWDGLRDTVGFFGIMIAANIVALLLYAFVAPAALFIFWGLNGYLIGREYFQLAAVRREGPEGAKAMRKANRFQIWVAGVFMAIPLSIPLINLFIPVLGAATFTHIYHRLASSPKGRRT